MEDSVTLEPLSNAMAALIGTLRPLSDEEVVERMLTKAWRRRDAGRVSWLSDRIAQQQGGVHVSDAE
jgi:hypothetical protein